jgi:hypothetical protein
MWRSLHFYSKAIIGNKEDLTAISSGDYLLTTEKKLLILNNGGKKYDVLYRGVDFPITRLSLKFINPNRREAQLERFALILIK